MSELFVSWSDYHRSIESLIAQIHRSGWAFDHVVCIARGGARVGDVIARAFRKPLSIVYAQYGETRDGPPRVSAHMASMEDTLVGTVLLVDDVAISGATLATVKKTLMTRNPTITEIRTAVVWQQGTCAEAPDYRAAYLAHNPRIHPPYEGYDLSSVDALVANQRD
jgi:uncharacterized protein